MAARGWRQSAVISYGSITAPREIADTLPGGRLWQAGFRRSHASAEQPAEERADAVPHAADEASSLDAFQRDDIDLFNTLSPCLTGAAATTSPFFVEHLALEDAEAVAHQHGALGGVTHRARIDVSTPHTTKEPAHRCARPNPQAVEPDALMSLRLRAGKPARMTACY